MKSDRAGRVGKSGIARVWCSCRSFAATDCPVDLVAFSTVCPRSVVARFARAVIV